MTLAADDSPLNLLLCVNPRSHPDSFARFTPATWAEILQQASHYSVTELLYQRLFRTKPELSLPPEILHEFRTAYYRTLAENARRYAVLEQALAVLRTAEIPVILLKGAYLAEAIYGDIGVRPMADFDLLVSLADLDRGMNALVQDGFELQQEFFEEVNKNLHRHAPSIIKDGTMLEVHRGLANPGGPLSPDLPGLWQRALPVSLQVGDALTLSPVDLLLYLCAHASYSHTFHNQLYSLCDIREVIAVKGDALDWNVFISLVDDWNARKGVYLALRLAEELVGARIPAQVLASLEPPMFDLQALAWAQFQLFRSTPALSSNFSRLMRRGSARKRLRALCSALFPSPMIMSGVYGVSPRSWRLIWLYPYNVVTRLTSYWRHVIALLKHDPRQIQEADISLNLLDWLGIKG